MPINWSVFWTTIAAFMGVSALVGTVALIVWSFDNANYWWILGMVVFAVLLAVVFGFATWEADQPGDQMRVCERCSVTMDAKGEKACPD